MDGEATANTTDENTKTHIPPQKVRHVETTFSFKKADPVSGEKRPPVKLVLPMPTFDGIVDFLTDTGEHAEKYKQFIVDLLDEQIREAARQQVSDEDKPVNEQKDLDLSKLTLHYLATLPPSERRAGGIAKETWEAFAKSYTETMPAITGKQKETIDASVELFRKRYNPCKTHKVALKKLLDYLDQWYLQGLKTDDEREEFLPLYEFLSNKGKAYLNSDELAKLVDNL